VIEVSQNELQGVKVIENAVQGRITVGEASRLLELSTRRVKWLKARYQGDQVDWVRHGNRGRPRPWAVSEAVKKRIVDLARNKYAGFNDSHLLRFPHNPNSTVRQGLKSFNWNDSLRVFRVGSVFDLRGSCG
jgi:hypothetical protein